MLTLQLGATINTAIASFTADEKTAFFKWYNSVSLYNIQQRTAKMASPLPDKKAYQATVQGVKWDDDTSLSTFYNSLYRDRATFAAQPVYLGQDSSFRYYLRPERPTMDISNDLPQTIKDHMLVVQVRCADQNAVPFQYGFCLGTLGSVPQDTRGNYKLESIQSHPFRIYMDVVTNDIWILYTTLFLDQNGDEAQLSDGDNAWDQLPSPQNNREKFKSMRLFKGAQGQSLWTVPETYNLFSTDARASVKDSIAKPWTADKAKVNQAVAAARGKGGSAAAA